MRVQDLRVSMLAGLAATWVMGQVTTALGDLQSPADKAREKAVSLASRTKSQPDERQKWPASDC